MERWVRDLNFKSIVPELIIKPIINPYKIDPPKDLTEAKKLLKEWISIWELIGPWENFCLSNATLIDTSIWDFISYTIWKFLGGRDIASSNNFYNLPIWIYCFSFLDLDKHKNNFSAFTKLWGTGLVPCLDNKGHWYLASKSGIKLKEYEI